MELTIAHDALKRGLAIVSHAVAGKSTLPVLSNVLLTAGEGRLSFAATNLEVGITHHAEAEVCVHGAVTIPAKLLSDVVGSLSNELMALKLDPHTQTLRIACGRFTTNIKGIDAEEFPTLPTPVPTATITLGGNLFRAIVRAVAFSAASDDSRPVLAGCRLISGDGVVSLAAADGFRLALQRENQYGVAAASETIIPARSLGIAAKVLQGEHIDMAISANNAALTSGETTLLTRLIEGKFPDVDRIIPQQHTTRLVCDVASLKRAVRLARLFAASGQNVLKFNIADGATTLSANAAEVGDSSIVVEAEVTGDDNQIAVNAVYLAELLDAVELPQVTIDLQGPQAPMVLRPAGSDGYTHIIMPMSIK